MFSEFLVVLLAHPSHVVVHLHVFIAAASVHVGARASSRIVHSLSLGRCHPVGQALLACVACAQLYTFHHILSTVHTTDVAFDQDFSFALLAIAELVTRQLFIEPVHHI